MMTHLQDLRSHTDDKRIKYIAGTLINAYVNNQYERAYDDWESICYLVDNRIFIGESSISVKELRNLFNL